MDNKTFAEHKRRLNPRYFQIFGEIPVMGNFSCTREEYILALEVAVKNKVKIETLLPKVDKPLNKNSLI